ncbi:Mob1/phocein [Aspergillus californicus]
MTNGSPAQSPVPPGHVSNSPSVASNHSAVESNAVYDPDAPKYFFQEKYAPLNVKGNFLTLCACPKNVELGEWLAHQIVEQYRLLHGMLAVIQEVNSHTGLPICNETTCPTMSAGRLTYTWLVDSQAAKISAPKFINRVEKWIVSKIHDPVMFPTEKVNSSVPETFALNEATGGSTPNAANEDWVGKSSGFPRSFYKDCQGIMKQMFRCYAHLYHAHWLNPFWHINKHDILNMCFVHFVTVAKYYKLVTDKEMEPMQPLIDLFIKQQRIPPEALSGGHWGQQSSG